jgi:dihydrodipicolinate synthase/N-acetylneuraminate lyase
MPVPDTDPIIVAPTPMPIRPDDSLDHDKLARNVEKWLKTDLDGFVVVSYGGEELHFGEPDKVASVKTVAQARKGQKFVIAGIDTPSPVEAVRLANVYAEAGADMVRVRIPGGARGGRASSGVIEYFEEVTKGSPVPVVVIHQPRAGLNPDATPEEIGEVTALDNVYAYIISLNYRWECRVPPFIAPGVKLWTCNGSIVMPGAMFGATGACLFFGNWGPRLVKDIIRLTMEGKYAEANRIQQSMVHADYLGMTLGTAALKAGLNMLGYEATVCRKPTLPLTKQQEAELRQAFIECGLLDK